MQKITFVSLSWEDTVSQYQILLTKVYYMDQWITLTALKTQNQEQTVVMIQYLWCSKIKKAKMTRDKQK